MKIIELIKKLLNYKTNDEIVEKTGIITYDISSIELPDYKFLEGIDKLKVLKYKKNINVKELDNLLFYNSDISKEGEKISNLLIKILYELKEIVRKDNKSEEQINEELINLAIKNIKIIVLKNMLEELLEETILKTVALIEFQKKELEKKQDFLGIFSFASKLKRKSEEESISEAIIRSKITIKVLKDQTRAINSAILANDTLINQTDIYNNLTDKVRNELQRKKIYSAIRYFLNINNFIFDNKLDDLDNLDNLLNNFSQENELKIIFQIAKIEIEIDKFIYDNKYRMISFFKEELNSLKVSKDSLEKIEKLELITKVFKDFIEEDNIEKLYQLKFNILTLDVNSNDNRIFNDLNCRGFKYYEKIIMGMISDVLNLRTEEMERFTEYGLTRQAISIFNKIFKQDNRRFDATEIIRYPYYLALLLAFVRPNGIRNFFNNFKFNHGRCHDLVELYENYNFDFESYLTADTICQLIESEVKYNDRKDVPYFYDLYRLLLKFEEKEAKKINGKNEKELYYKIPEGIKEFGIMKHNYIAFLKQINEKSKDKIVVFPKSISRLDDSLFEPDTIKGAYLNEGLKYLGPFAFKGQKLSIIRIPSTLENIDNDICGIDFIKVLEFSNFKNSKLLCDFLWSNEPWVLKFIQSMFYIDFKEIVLYDEFNNKYVIERKYLNLKTRIIVTSKDALEVRKRIRELIKQRTGYDVPNREILEKNSTKTLRK